MPIHFCDASRPSESEEEAKERAANVLFVLQLHNANGDLRVAVEHRPRHRLLRTWNIFI